MPVFSYSITDFSFSKVELKHPPFCWKDFQDEISAQPVDVAKFWRAVQKIKFQANKVAEVFLRFREVLQELKLVDNKVLPLWTRTNGSKTDPSLVIYRGDWNPENRVHRANVIIDFEIVQRFNPISRTEAPRAGYLGDTAESYVQALTRASQAFAVDPGLEYFVVVTDMEHIIFWKITAGNAIRAFGAGPYNFGGKYHGMTFTSNHSSIGRFYFVFSY